MEPYYSSIFKSERVWFDWVFSFMYYIGTILICTYCCVGNEISGALAWKQIPYINGLVQDCSKSSALAMELLQSYTKPSICSVPNSTCPGQFSTCPVQNLLRFASRQALISLISLPYVRRHHESCKYPVGWFSIRIFTSIGIPIIKTGGLETVLSL